jgi:hypothetical protein
MQMPLQRTTQIHCHLLERQTPHGGDWSSQGVGIDMTIPSAEHATNQGEGALKYDGPFHRTACRPNVKKMNFEGEAEDLPCNSAGSIFNAREQYQFVLLKPVQNIALDPS